MHALRQFIADQGIRGHLRTPLASRPIFCRSQELRSNAALPVVFRNVPAFDVTDRMRGTAAIRVRAQADLYKTYQRSITHFRNENHQRQGGERISSKNRYKLTRVLFGRRFRPERFAQARQRGAIGRLRESDASICHQAMLTEPNAEVTTFPESEGGK